MGRIKLQNKLPADPTSIALGAVSLGIVFLSCCAWFLAPFFWVLGLVLGIVGLSMANKSQRLYATDPESYYYKTNDNVRNGKIVCIIGIIVNAIALLITIGFVIFVGTGIPKDFFKKFNEKKEYHYEMAADTLNAYDDDSLFIVEPVTDTISIDTIKQE